MFPQASIAAVDDNLDHLNSIGTVLDRLGLPSVMLHYDVTEEMNEHKGLRILFLDLHLSPDSDSPHKKADALAAVLKELKIQGPWFAIFWSQATDELEEVLDRLIERHTEVHPPIGHAIMDKVPFLVAKDGTINREKLAEVQETLEQILDHSPQVKALLAWDGRMQQAAGDCLANLLNMIPNTSGWRGPLDQNALPRLFWRIACASYGLGPAQVNITRAIESGLFPILEDRLAALSHDADIQKIWEHFIDIELRSAPPDKDKLISATLNRFFLIDNSVEDKDKGRRGVFCELTLRDNDWEKIFGLRKEIIVGNFANLGKKIKKTEDRDNALNNIRYGLIEIGPACDHAQSKAFQSRLILAALVSENFLSPISTSKQFAAKDCVFALKPFLFNNSIHHLSVHLGAIITAGDFDGFVGSPFFRLREQVVNDIAFRFAHHFSRLGLITAE